MVKQQESWELYIGVMCAVLFIAFVGVLALNQITQAQNNGLRLNLTLKSNAYNVLNSSYVSLGRNYSAYQQQVEYNLTHTYNMTLATDKAFIMSAGVWETIPVQFYNMTIYENVFKPYAVNMSEVHLPYAGYVLFNATSSIVNTNSTPTWAFSFNCTSKCGILPELNFYNTSQYHTIRIPVLPGNYSFQFRNYGNQTNFIVYSAKYVGYYGAK